MKNKSPLSFLSVSSSFVVLFLALALTVLKVNTPTGQNFNVRTQAGLTESTISLIPTKASYPFNPKEDYRLVVLVESEKKLSTLSLQVNFDPQKISIDPQTLDGKIFDQQMKIVVDNTNGVVSVFGSNLNPHAISSAITTLIVHPKQKGEVKFTLIAGAISQGRTLSTKLNDAVVNFE